MPKTVAVLVSIITIVRNDSPGLSRTRASIAAQVGMNDLEWVIVDGASTDGTAQLALGLDEAYASTVSEPDRGIFDAMNKGLERAAGTFVVFLNAGDSFANAGVLERVGKCLSSNTIDFLCGNCGTVLLHAENDQVHGLFIHCTQCGACNATVN